MRRRDRRGRLVLAAAAIAGSAVMAQGAAAQTTEDLLRRIEALQRRVEELEAARGAAARAPQAASRAPSAPAARAPRTVAAVQPGSVVVPAPAAASQAPGQAVADAARPRVTREEIDAALRGSMPNSLRIPGTETSVRLYGFIKANMWGALNVRDRGDGPAVQGIALAGSPADRQGGDLNFNARRSRIGFDTQTPSDWGQVFTRIELDFVGDQPSAAGAATSSGYMPRLRLAYVEVGGDIFRVLVGQAGSVWAESPLETLVDSTFLNASAVRQAQVRLTGRLAQGLTGQVSIEAPYTDYASPAGIFYPDSTYDGGASPAINHVPDLLARLNYTDDFGEASVRGLVRQLKIETSGTRATGSGSDSTIGWGLAANVNLALRNVWSGFGNDRLIGMAYYGEGIGRYFDSAYSGQGAYTNLGLPGATTAFSMDATQTWGFLVGYRLAWLTELRSTFAYAYARQDNPGYVAEFRPGSAAALSANREMQMALANLIWSPFARENGGRISNGWLDVGVEYTFFRRDIQGGAAAAGAGQYGHGIEHRLQTSLIARF